MPEVRRGLPVAVSKDVAPSHHITPELVSSRTSQSMDPESSMPKITLGLASTEAFRGNSARGVVAA